MIKETIYSERDLHFGKCTSCSEESDEILNDDGKCVDCIESDDFYEMTMKLLDE